MSAALSGPLPLPVGCSDRFHRPGSGPCAAFHFSVSLIHLSDVKDTWNEIKLAGIKDYFQKQYPDLEIHYDVVMSNDFLNSLDNYIKTNQIDIITLTSYKRNIFSRLFNPGIARKMIFHSDTPLLVING